MSDKGSVFSKGGGGTNFEQYIQTAFLTSMITQGNVPGIKDSTIIEIALQATRLGYKTDDLFVRCSSPLGKHRLVAQIKHEFSFTLKDETFKEVITQLWSDFNNKEIFNQDYDKLLIIKEYLNKTEANNIKSLINWAKSKSSASDFILETKRIKKKEETLNIFRTVIEDIHTYKITDETIWAFFKCLELLAYDFGNHDSTHKAYYLNLIKLSKSSESKLSESEIWSQLYEFISLINKDGGQISVESISKEPFFTHFKVDNLTLFHQSIEKLDKDSKLILNQLSNEIHGFHIERFDLKQQIVDSINNQRITFITGNPGVGKSAIINDVLKEEFESSHLIVFRADQLNQPHLSNVFTNLGVNNSIEDILSCLSLIPQKIIFIDSLEKLLEGDSENAFKQLYITLDKYPDIKIVAASRKYAFNLLYFKYGINKTVQPIEISTLNETELSLIKNKFPQLNQVFSNAKIKQLLISPKYIDYALTLLLKDDSDYSNISLTDFKNKLWNHIVENISNRKAGLPRKRGKAFSKIAVDRAKSMCLFVEPKDVDDNVVDELENDNLIYKDGDNYKFSPTHDILEDWALIRYISEKEAELQSPNDFFNQIGNKPAIRRAFRLWVEDSLIDDKEKILELVKNTTEIIEIEKFWADELLIAIFKSDNSEIFIDEFRPKFLNNDYNFLKRCIHLIRTTCKESGSNNSRLLIPIGSGWGSMIKLISENKEEFDTLRNLIINFLIDWESKLYFNEEMPVESPNVTDIVKYYLTQIENKDEFWFSYSNDNKYDGIITLLFNLVPISKDCTIKLIDNALTFERNDDNWRLRDFYEKVIDKCLSGIYSRKVVKEFPDKICDVAWNEWKYAPPKTKAPFDYHSSIDTNIYFGLKDHLKDSPPGIYKTPFWNMLWSHTYKAFDFIIEFTNYCCENYFNSEFSKDDDVVEFEIKIGTDKVIKQKGSYVLWQAYRGTGKVTPDVFRSVLISLEKYLLIVASYKNETSKKLIKHYFYYLLERSNNVAISSVLVSLCIAHPEEVEESILNILRVKEFYKWDFHRALSEHMALAPMDFDISFAQKEMYDYNQLPHRKRFQRGLQDFIVDYQFKIGKYNKEIFEIFDDFRKSQDEDIIWKKSLNEMDIRKWEIAEYNKEVGGVIIQPKYEGEVKAFVDSNKPEFEEQNTAATHSNWSYKKFKNEKEASPEFENWQKAFQYLSQKKAYDFMFDKPATLAHVGLKDYNTFLSTNEKEWCVNTLVDSLAKIQAASWDRYSLSMPEINLMDREPILKSFSLIFSYASLKPEDERELATLLFYCLICPIAPFEKAYLLEDYRNNLWEINPNIAENIWHLLIHYSAYKKSNHFYINDPQKQEEANKNEFDFISRKIGVDLQFNKEDISFETHVGHFLLLAVVLLPFDSAKVEHKEYIKLFFEIFLDAIYGDDRLHEEFRKIQIQHEDKTVLMKYLSKLILIQTPVVSKEILNVVLEKYYSFIDDPRKTKDIHEFIKQTLEFTICELDFIVNEKNHFKDYTKDKFIEQFWNLWESLHKQINNSGKLHFSSLLFLDIYSYGITWDENFKDWEPLRNREDYYKKIILEKGSSNIRAILNIFVSIGHTRFLPQGLNWLVEVLKQNPDKLDEVMTSKGEHLIENLFHHYCFKIKDNKTMLDNYIWLLDNMIDLGSSLAYLIRDNVITYKSN